MIRPIIAGNWKMHKRIGEAVAFAKALKKAFPDKEDTDIIIAPPFTALSNVAEILKGSPIGLAAQNLHEAEGGKGAFTGEISAEMIADAGCRHVIIGHSERRILFGETDERINKKLLTALKYGLKPILCIGETLAARDNDRTFPVIFTQLKEGLKNIATGDIGAVTIAYEPVWAIGTGKTATPDQAEEVHGYIRTLITEAYGKELAGRLAIIYGGSVNPDNIGNLMAQANINGALVGGASLEAESFIRLVRY